jgi:hypothetical protein
MLEHWHEFYLLLGTAAAALVALLFVAASIGAGLVSAERGSNTRTYMSPVVFHFTTVLFVSLIALVPSQTRLSIAVLIAASGLVAGIYSIVILIRVLKNRTIDLADRLGYGVTPVIGYAAALFAAALFFIESHRAPDVLAGAVLLLLIVNIRNAWDLTLFFAGKQNDPR